MQRAGLGKEYRTVLGAICSHLAGVRLLLYHKARVDKEDTYGATVVHWAAAGCAQAISGGTATPGPQGRSAAAIWLGNIVA